LKSGDEGLPSSHTCTQAAAGARVKAARSAPPEAAAGLDARGAPWLFVVPGWLHEESDCSRIFGLVRGAVSAPGHHGNPRAGRQSLARPLTASRVIGVAPRRSDRCAMVRCARCSPPG